MKFCVACGEATIIGSAEIDALPDPWAEAARVMLGANGAGRWAAFLDWAKARPDGAQLIESVYAVDPDADPHAVSEAAEPQPDAPACPELPEYARLTTEPAAGWVDDYSLYAEALSPMTPRLFHESAALWLASVAIARRIVLKMPYGDVYPNLFILWIALTTLYRKTTALDVARGLARNTFPFLMAAQDTTPEAFLSDLAGKEPTGWERMTAEEQAAWNAERNYAAERGWVIDEMSGMLAGAGKDYNAGLLEALLRFYDCDSKYVRSTRGQGRVTVKNSYLCLLGASTPEVLSEHINAARLWAMGFWPRFALLTPDEGRPEWIEPRGADDPRDLADQLMRLFNRLPAATWPTPPQAITATLGAGVFDAWTKFNKALSFDLLNDDLDGRLRGTYGRLPTQALKVAMILAALDWPPHAPAPRIELPHLARAIAIVESWRASAHRVIVNATASEFSQLTKRILRQLAKHDPGGATVRDLCRAMVDKRPAEIESALAELVTAGLAEEVETKPGKQGGRPTKRYRPARG